MIHQSDIFCSLTLSSRQSNYNRTNTKRMEISRKNESEDQTRSRRTSMISQTVIRRSEVPDDVTAERTRTNTIRASVTRAKERSRPHRVRKSTRQRAVSRVGATDAQPDPHYMGRMDQVNKISTFKWCR
ncbi:hypothetical protein GCK72_012738 [Caenorhabditis remanei]|uniref:Uncharacterized protein n=1 Tax=Caenorhabditis remanei TaxID=31234 RepID=A0A6A5GP21_CAERE|nr:hypothetical protein GCK72_012738 [Caenorhabditis remanei]KAF1756285.1 hypothetical protein GCK72_012738 [Caenorhabditis remanei]